jgi:hypothetical protein
MTEISPLRRRMIDDMTIRNLSPATQRSYLHAVAKFSRYFGRSPDRLGLEDVRAFQVHLVSLAFYGLLLTRQTAPSVSSMASRLPITRYQNVLPMPERQPSCQLY